MNIKHMIDECVRNTIITSLKEQRMNQHIDNVVSEVLKRNLYEAEYQNTEMKRNAVMSMLKNDLYDHATLAYQLYDANDDSQKATARSLFSKKATGHPDADGQIRRFDDTEINKLYDLLRTKK